LRTNRPAPLHVLEATIRCTANGCERQATRWSNPVRPSSMEALAELLDKLSQIVCVLLDNFSNLGRARRFGSRLRFLTPVWLVFGRIHVRTVRETQVDLLSQIKQLSRKCRHLHNLNNRDHSGVSSESRLGLRNEKASGGFMLSWQMINPPIRPVMNPRPCCWQQLLSCHCLLSLVGLFSVSRWPPRGATKARLPSCYHQCCRACSGSIRGCPTPSRRTDR
jgi:hypothetical protein